MGEAPNFALLPVACAALDRLLDWGVPAIQATLAARTAAIAARAAPARPRRRATGAPRRAFPRSRLSRTGPAADLPDRLAAARVHVSLRGAACG